MELRFIIFIINFCLIDALGDGCKSFKRLLETNGFSSSLVPIRPISTEKLTVCHLPSSPTCCNDVVESQMRQKSLQDFTHTLTKLNDPYKEELITFSQEIEATTEAMLRQSQMETESQMEKMHKTFNKTAVPIVRRFFQNLRSLVKNTSDNFTYKHVVRNIKKEVRDLYGDLFPLVWTCLAVEGNCNSVDESYRNCLRSNFSHWHPFKKEPTKMANQLASFLGHVISLRYSLQTFIQTFSHFENHSFTCAQQLTQMRYCSSCADPLASLRYSTVCKNYCMDTVKNCLSSKWLQTWDRVMVDFDSTIRRYGRSSAFHDQEALVEFSSRLDNTLTTLYMRDGPAIARKVTDDCGPFSANHRKIKDKKMKKKYKVGHHSGIFPVWDRIFQLVNGLSSYKSWWTAQIPMHLCNYGDAENCWNGTALGRYTRPVLPLGKEGRPDAASKQSGMDDNLEEKMQNIHKILAEARGEKVDQYKDGSSMLTRSTDPKRPYAQYDKRQPMAMDDKSEWIDGSGDMIDIDSSDGWFSPRNAYSDDEDLRDGSGSGDFESLDTFATNDNFKSAGLKPVWSKPAVTDPPGGFETSDTHPEDRNKKKSPTSGAYGQYSSQFMTWRTLVLLLIAYLLR